MSVQNFDIICIMKISDLKIIIENLRGSYKKFADSLDEYPILGVTYPTHYGYIKGYVSEDNQDLDVFIGNGSLLGYIKVRRDDTPEGIETKVFLHISDDEYNKIIEIYEPVLSEKEVIETEDDFLSFLESFKDKRPILGVILIGVSSLEKAKDFYVNAFGMVIDEFRPPFMEGYLGDGLIFNIEENTSTRDAGWAERNVGTYKNTVLSVKDIFSFLQKVESSGGSIIKKPEEMPWGYLEAQITDLDKNLFVVEQEIKSL